MSEETWPDGSARRWPDGTMRSFGNCFTHCTDGQPHGYEPGGELGPARYRNRRGPRSELAFGVPGGTMPGMGSEAGPVPRMIPRESEKKAA